jgi:transcriptional regulator with XRE-family HTH domain
MQAVSDERLSAFGERIKRKRQDLGLSQSQLAKASGLSRTTINRAEKGEVELRVVNAMKIAEGLGITARELFA